jgi:hypothetical protein
MGQVSVRVTAALLSPNHSTNAPISHLPSTLHDLTTDSVGKINFWHERYCSLLMEVALCQIKLLFLTEEVALYHRKLLFLTEQVVLYHRKLLFLAEEVALYHRKFLFLTDVSGSIPRNITVPYWESGSTARKIAFPYRGNSFYTTKNYCSLRIMSLFHIKSGFFWSR